MGWFFNRKKRTKTPLKSRKPLTRKQKLLQLAQSKTYYSVKITRCGCAASSKLINKCFLFNEAPDLPLPDCDAGQCTCEYQGLICRRRSDRRKVMRRAAIRMGDDRRQKNRRKSEKLWNKYDI